MKQRTYGERDAVDFVIVGSGAAGGVLAKELSVAGFDVVVLEQGPWQQASQFTHDELAVEREQAMLNRAFEPLQTLRTTPDAPARLNTGRGLLYRRAVGGSSVHFAANYWRFRPIDFTERSVLGSISGTGLDDWPITYEELEPYYTKVDWEIGVSGAPGPFDPPRSRPFPLPPLPNKSGGVLLERGLADHVPRRRRPPAWHRADGERPAQLGGGSVPPRARCAEPVHLRRLELRYVGARPADHDDSGTRVPGGGAHRAIRARR